MAELPKAPFGRICKSAGASRISESAEVALAEAAEEYAIKVSENAIKIAKHAGRKTVKDIDIQYAVKEYTVE